MQIRPKVHRPPSPPNQRLLRRTSELLTRWGNCRGHYVCLKVRADVKNVQKCERYLGKDLFFLRIAVSFQEMYRTYTA